MRNYLRGETFHEGNSSLESPKAAVSRGEHCELQGRLRSKIRRAGKSTSAQSLLFFLQKWEGQKDELLELKKARVS